MLLITAALWHLCGTIVAHFSSFSAGTFQVLRMQTSLFRFYHSSVGFDSTLLLGHSITFVLFALEPLRGVLVLCFRSLSCQFKITLIYFKLGRSAASLCETSHFSSSSFKATVFWLAPPLKQKVCTADGRGFCAHIQDRKGTKCSPKPELLAHRDNLPHYLKHWPCLIWASIFVKVSMANRRYNDPFVWFVPHIVGLLSTKLFSFSGSENQWIMWVMGKFRWPINMPF